jgi:hypothetical protein
LAFSPEIIIVLAVLLQTGFRFRSTSPFAHLTKQSLQVL